MEVVVMNNNKFMLMSAFLLCITGSTGLFAPHGGGGGHVGGHGNLGHRDNRLGRHGHGEYGHWGHDGWGHDGWRHDGWGWGGYGAGVGTGLLVGASLDAGAGESNTTIVNNYPGPNSGCMQDDYGNWSCPDQGEQDDQDEDED